MHCSLTFPQHIVVELFVADKGLYYFNGSELDSECSLQSSLLEIPSSSTYLFSILFVTFLISKKEQLLQL